MVPCSQGSCRLLAPGGWQEFGEVLLCLPSLKLLSAFSDSEFLSFATRLKYEIQSLKEDEDLWNDKCMIKYKTLYIFSLKKNLRLFELVIITYYWADNIQIKNT